VSARHRLHRRYRAGRDSFCCFTDRACRLVGCVIGPALRAGQTIPTPLWTELRHGSGRLRPGFAAGYLAIVRGSSSRGRQRNCLNRGMICRKARTPSQIAADRQPETSYVLPAGISVSFGTIGEGVPGTSSCLDVSCPKAAPESDAMQKRQICNVATKWQH